MIRDPNEDFTSVKLLVKKEETYPHDFKLGELFQKNSAQKAQASKVIIEKLTSSILKTEY